MAEHRVYDIVIVGGGPAGLTCGQYGARAGRKTVILEEMGTGGQTMYIDQIENYPGLESLSGYELAARFEKQAMDFGCEIEYASVENISKNKESFTIQTTIGVFEAPTVIIATGAKHRTLGVPGEKELTGHGVSYCATCDGPFFRKKRIMVCGGGDSACQEALFLSKLSDDVTICHRRSEFRAQASIVKAVMEAGIKTVMDSTVTAINGKDGKVSSVTLMDNATKTEKDIDVDAVFVFVGNQPQTQLVPDCEKDSSGFIVTDAHMMTSIPGMFAIGDVRDTPFRQIVTAASDGAIAAHWASEYIDSLTR